MIGSLDDLVRMGVASAPTLRAWLRELPDDTDWIIKRGAKGDAYELDLEAAAKAFAAREAARTEEERRRADEVKQLGLSLGLGERGDEAPGLSIKERQQLLEEELVAIKIAKERRELVPRASVEAAFGDVLVKFRQRGATFAARLAKKVDLTREQITAIDRLMAADQAELARMMENMGRDLGDGSGQQDVAAGADPAAAVEHPAL